MNKSIFKDFESATKQGKQHGMGEGEDPFHTLEKDKEMSKARTTQR